MLRLSFLVLLVQILTQKALLLVTNSTSVGANAEDSSTTDPLVLQSILIDTQQVILLHAYVSACYWICVLILLYMCPQVLQSILIDAQPVIHRPGLEALLEAGNRVVQVLKSFTPAKEGTAESAKGGGEGGVSRSRGGGTQQLSIKTGDLLLVSHTGAKGWQLGTQFACFTGTKVRILTQKAAVVRAVN
jgi:hypothetical protein